MFKDLKEKLAALATKMRELHALTVTEDRGFTADERTTWDAMIVDFEVAEQRLKDAEQLASIGTAANAGLPANLDGNGDDDDAPPEVRTMADGRALPEYRDAYNVYLRHGAHRLTEDQRSLLGKYKTDMESRAQSVGTDSEGGFTVPEGFAGFITEAMQDFSGLLGAANPGGNGGPTLLVTASGNTIPFPTNDDTANSGSIIAENAQVSEQDLVFGARNLTAYMYSSDLIRVSLQLLQDEAVNLEQYIGNALGKRIGRALSPHFAIGTGTGQPTGLATAATDGAINISVAAGVTYDNLVDFEHALDPAYRRRGASWVFNDTILADLKKLVDGNLRPLWLPAALGGIADQGARPTLMGYGYIIDQGMESLVIGDRPIAFGDLSEFMIRQVLGVNLFKFEERYMDFLQKGFLGFARFDSNLIDVNAVVTDIAVA